MIKRALTRSLTREVLQRAQLLSTRHRCDVLVVDAESVQATVIERDALAQAASRMLLALESGLGMPAAEMGLRAALDLVRRG